MSDVRDFEHELREDLFRTAQAVRVPAGAVDRAIRAAREQEYAELVDVEASSRVGSWLRPLLAAAAVLVLIAGVALAANWPFGDHDTRPTQHPTPVPTATTPTPTPSSTPSPRPSGTAGGSGVPFRVGAPVLQATQRYVIRPVTASGEPEPGYRVTTYTPTYSGYSCDALDLDPVTVDRGVATCGGVSDNTEACWKAHQPSTVLCLVHPSVRTLTRVKITGHFPSLAPPAEPRPLEIVLDSGTDCHLDIGVAGEYIASHPTWFPDYFCADGEVSYGPAPGDGIDRSSSRWTVLTTNGASTNAEGELATPLSKRGVRAVYYVGTN